MEVIDEETGGNNRGVTIVWTEEPKPRTLQTKRPSQTSLLPSISFLPTYQQQPSTSSLSQTTLIITPPPHNNNNKEEDTYIYTTKELTIFMCVCTIKLLMLIIPSSFGILLPLQNVSRNNFGPNVVCIFTRTHVHECA